MWALKKHGCKRFFVLWLLLFPAGSLAALVALLLGAVVRFGRLFLLLGLVWCFFPVLISVLVSLYLSRDRATTRRTDLWQVSPPYSLDTTTCYIVVHVAPGYWCGSPARSRSTSSRASPEPLLQVFRFSTRSVVGGRTLVTLVTHGVLGSVSRHQRHDTRHHGWLQL